MAARLRTALAALLLPLSWLPALAQQGPLYEEIDDWLVRLEDRDTAFVECFEALTDRRVRFQQITEADPYLSAPVRERINQIVVESIPRRWALRSSVVIGEEVRQGNPDVSAEAQLRDLRTAPITVRAEVRRSHLDIARLIVTVVLRAPDGLLCDSSTRVWHFDIGTLEPVDSPPFSPREVDIYDFDATLRDGLRRTPPTDLPPDATIPYVVTTDFAGDRCALSEEALVRDLQRAAADVADPIGSLIGQGVRAYAPLSAAEAEEIPHLQVVTTRSIRAAEEIADSVAVVEFVWRQGQGRSPGVARIVALPRGALEDCAGAGDGNPVDTFLANAEDPERYGVRIRPLADPFRVGDRLELDFDADEPVFAYCWVLNEDGAVVLFPHHPVLAAEPLAADTYRIPEDFFLNPIPIRDSGTSLFHCYVTGTEVPRSLTERWLDAHRAQAILAWPTAEELSRDFRQVATVSEVWTFIHARGE